MIYEVFLKKILQAIIEFIFLLQKVSQEVLVMSYFLYEMISGFVKVLI